MARIGQLIYAPEVQDKVSGPLSAIGAAADRTGAAFEGLDTRVRRNEASFEQVAARLDVVERAAQKVERATASFTRSMEQAERQALAQGIAQERLAQVLASGAQAREAAALAAVRGLTAEQQAAALTRAGYENLAAQIQATARAQAAQGESVSRLNDAAAAAQRAAAAQQTYNQALGVAASGGYESRAADIAAYGAELDRLQAKYDPLFAAQQRYKAALAEIAQAERVGALSAAQAAAARTNEAARLNANTAAVQSLAAANDNVVRSSGNMRAALGQVGFQVQDFATQVSMGQNALMAFGVQGAQLAGFFGATGALAGAVLMIAVIAAQLLLGKSAADAFTDSMTRQSDALKMVEEDARRYREGLADEARQVRELTDYYGSLSQARQSQEMRQFRRDQADLEGTQDRLRTDALGSTSGLSRAFQSQLSEAQMMAERSYGRGSREFNLIVSNPEFERMREFIAVVEGFRETGDVSREALARLYQQMLGLADGSDVVSRRIRAQAEVIDGLTGKAREAEQAQAALSARAQALGINVDSAATAADRLNRQLAAMSRYDQGISTNLGTEISRLQREFAAASVGAERLQQVRAQLSREDRLERMVSDRRKELDERGITGDAATASLEEFRSQIEPTLSRIGQLQDGIRGLEAGFRNTGSAIREASQEFQDLRRHTSGLLVGNTADVRGIEEIARQIRGTQLDPAVRARAEAEVQRAAEREATRRDAETDRFTQNWGDRLALETTRGIFEGTKNGESAAQRFGNMLKNVLTSAVSAALSRQVFQPLVSAGYNAFSSGAAGLGNLLGFGGSTLGGAAAVADPGSTQGAISQLGQFGALNAAGNYGNLGPAFMGQGAAGTGFAGLDSFLNYQLVAPSGVGGILPAGVSGPLAPATGGLSVAGALGGAAGIAGGAYGIYSGLERGGIGGYTTAAGGALSAGLGAAALAGLAVPGIGWAIAAGLAIAGALMPGQQQSGRGQLSRINLNTANQSFEGLGGDRYSAGNRDAATNTVNSIADMARQIGDKLGGARIGGDVAVGVTSGRGNGPGQLYLQIGANTQQFANDEAGSKQLAETAARLILDEFRRQGTATGDFAGILAASPTVEVLSQNLEWYEKTYKVLTQATEPVSAFQQSIDQLTAQFQPAIDKARELSLSVDAMTQARERELAKLEEQRQLQLRSFGGNLDVRRLRAQGAGQAADLLAFDLNAENERRTARESLESLGLNAEQVAERLVWVENTLADERLAVLRTYADQARAVEEQAAAERQRIAEQAASAQIDSARTILDYLNGQALGGTSSLSPTARLAEAERQFNAALQGGDARSLTSAADALLTNSQVVFGGASQAFAQREASVRQVLVNRGTAATNEGATVAALSQMTAALTAELASLRSGFDALVAETRRTNNQAMVA
jgi:precorrin-6B methylase 1